MTDKPRIVIYGMGQVGQTIVRLATEKGWPIAAAFNRAGNKVGKDIGLLTGLEYELGIHVEDCDAASYQTLQADIGIVAVSNFLEENMVAYERLLGAGLNVLCHGTESYYPFSCNANAAHKIDGLAKEHGVTFTGSGIWDMSRIWSGILATGPCTSIRSFYHKSITDCSRFGKVQMLYTGVDTTVEEFEKNYTQSHKVFTAYKTISQQVLTVLGYHITETRLTIEPVIADKPIFCEPLGRDVEAGHVLGPRIVINIDTEENVTATSEIELRLFEEDEVEHMMWSIDGMPRTRVRVERDDSLHASASSLFNRIPDVLHASPGIIVVSELGLLSHTALLKNN